MLKREAANACLVVRVNKGRRRRCSCFLWLLNRKLCDSFFRSRKKTPRDVIGYCRDIYIYLSFGDVNGCLSGQSTSEEQ